MLKIPNGLSREYKTILNNQARQQNELPDFRLNIQAFERQTTLHATEDKLIHQPSSIASNCLNQPHFQCS